MIKSGAYAGAFAAFSYAIAIPFIKFLMLILAECWRCSEDAGRVRRARWCIRTVQVISKWACPDMFAYILLLYLFHRLDGSKYLNAPAELDIGFTCFSIFCTLSTF